MSDEFDDAIRPDRVERVSPPPRPRSDDRPRRREYDDDEPPPASGGSGVKTVIIVLSVVAIVGFCVIGSAVGLLVYAVRGAAGKVSQAAARIETSNNYKQIALAMHSYHDKHGHLPPVSLPTTDGKPGLSWRVALLPFLEHDSFTNSSSSTRAGRTRTTGGSRADATRLRAPKSYTGELTHVRSSSAPRRSSTRRSRNARSVKSARRRSTALLLVEGTDATLWIKPDELPFDSRAATGSLGLPDNDYFMMSFADGSIRVVKKSVNAEKIKHC